MLTSIQGPQGSISYGTYYPVISSQKPKAVRIELMARKSEIDITGYLDAPAPEAPIARNVFTSRALLD